MIMDRLPDEMLCNVLNHVPLTYFVFCRRVNRMWNYLLRALVLPRQLTARGLAIVGDLRLLKMLHTDDLTGLCNYAVADLETLQFLSTTRSINEKTLEKAAKHGPKNVVEWLLMGPIPHGSVESTILFIKFASMRGWLDIIKAYIKPTEFGVAIGGAADGNQVEVLKWLLEQDYVKTSLQTGLNHITIVLNDALGDSLRKNSVDCARIFTCITDAGVMPNADTFNVAVEVGNEDMIKHMIRSGVFNVKQSFRAYDNASLNVCKLLFGAGVPWDCFTLRAIFRRGCVAEALWLIQHGCPLSSDAFNEAIELNNKELLLALRARGCMWDENSLFIAIEFTCMDIIRWLQVIGCEWSPKLYRTAIDFNRFEVVNWLFVNGCPADCCAIAAAHKYEDHDLCWWLIQREFPLQKTYRSRRGSRTAESDKFNKWFGEISRAILKVTRGEVRAQD